MDETTNNPVLDAPSTTNAAPAATVTTARETRVSDETMIDQMSRLSTEALTEWLDRYGYVAQPNTPKKDLIKAILTLHHKQIEDSEKLVKESTEATAAVDEEIVTMKFMSLESPGASYEFAYPGPKGFQKGKNGKVLPAPKWHFFHNHSYRVPYWMYKHLNALMVPADVKVETDAQGFIQSLYSGDTNRQQRFSCTLELTPEQERRMIQKG